MKSESIERDVVVVIGVVTLLIVILWAISLPKPSEEQAQQKTEEKAVCPYSDHEFAWFPELNSFGSPLNYYNITCIPAEYCNVSPQTFYKKNPEEFWFSINERVADLGMWLHIEDEIGTCMIQNREIHRPRLIDAESLLFKCQRWHCNGIVVLINQTLDDKDKFVIEDDLSISNNTLSYPYSEVIS